MCPQSLLTRYLFSDHMDNILDARQLAFTFQLCCYPGPLELDPEGRASGMPCTGRKPRFRDALGNDMWLGICRLPLGRPRYRVPFANSMARLRAKWRTHCISQDPVCRSTTLGPFLRFLWIHALSVERRKNFRCRPLTFALQRAYCGNDPVKID